MRFTTKNLGQASQGAPDKNHLVARVHGGGVGAVAPRIHASWMGDMVLVHPGGIPAVHPQTPWRARRSCRGSCGRGQTSIETLAVKR